MPPDPGTWRKILRRHPLFAGLNETEQQALRGLAELFLAEKRLDLVGGLHLDASQRLLLAAQACLPVLELGPDLCDNWTTLIVYPGTFLPGRSEMDEIGVVHAPRPRVGEAWPNGPVILSWRDVERDLAGEWDYPMNVVIHEICHQLDVRSGDFDGMPPLHAGMDPARWIRSFSDAFDALRRAVDRKQESWLDPYAGESPAEFFAVAGETFFVAPELLQEGYPGVYEQLQRYFRQDPLTRIDRGRPLR